MIRKNLCLVTTLYLAAALMIFCTMTVHDAKAGIKDTIQTSGIALMPFWLGRPTPELGLKKKSMIDCTLAELCYLEGNPLENAAEIMNEIVQVNLKKRYAEKVVSPDMAGQAYSIIAKKDTDTLRDIAIRLGRELKVEHVLAGTLWKYDQRRGSAMAAESPAAVGFALFLVAVGDGGILWEGVFDKTQTALSENLFDTPLIAKQGMKWLTARELATYGVDKLMKNFPAK